MTEWRKSSHSQNEVNTECIEVSTNIADAALIRDSMDPDGPRLTLTRNGLADLLHHVKAWPASTAAARSSQT